MSELIFFFFIVFLHSNISIHSCVGRHDKTDAVGAALLPLGWGLLCQLQCHRKTPAISGPGS